MACAYCVACIPFLLLGNSHDLYSRSGVSVPRFLLYRSMWYGRAKKKLIADSKWQIIMNDTVLNYIEKRKKEIALEREKEKHQLLEKLELGKRVYSESSTQTLEFPLKNDDGGIGSKNAYKIEGADKLTDEEYEELRKYSQKGYGTAKANEESGWSTFATVMMVLGGVAVLIVLYTCTSNGYHKDLTPFFIALGAYLGELGLWAIVQLLAKIERNTRKS